MQVFIDQLLKEVMSHRKNNYTDNYDPMMKYDADFNLIKTRTRLEKILGTRVPLADNLSFPRTLAHYFVPKKFYHALLGQYSEAAYLYSLLSDEPSKKLLLTILAYRILGYQRVKLPRNTPDYWNDIQRIEKLNVGHGTFKIKFLNFDLPLYDLNPLGFPILINGAAQGLACIFTQRQYEYHGQRNIKAEKGDVVLDCGACWADTALYFSHEVGSKGKVYAFEFVPDNVDIFNLNLSHNPNLAANIHLIKHPVWNVSGEELIYADHGPGSSVHQTSVDVTNQHSCSTIAIDDFVEQEQLSRVDFIKMDIEGAELNALRGAEKTIKRFKPKLAISAYHKADDFIILPTYLNNLGVDYNFYLNHHTIHKWETVLYAIPK